jgi:V-type H+-transporting ATPase subunit H
VGRLEGDGRACASRCRCGASPRASTPRSLAWPCSWNSYEAAGIISREQLEMLFCYDKQPIATQVALFMQRGEAYVELFVVILQNVNKEETVQYVLALLDDLLVGARAARRSDRATRRLRESGVRWRGRAASACVRPVACRREAASAVRPRRRAVTLFGPRFGGGAAAGRREAPRTGARGQRAATL